MIRQQKNTLRLRSSILKATPPPSSGGNRIAFSGNSTQGLHLFRSEAILRLHQSGYEVYIIAPFDTYVAPYVAQGIHYRDSKISSQSLSLGEQIRNFKRLQAIYREVKPDLIFHYTIKPNIFGTLAARSLGIPSISIVPGLGAFPDIQNTFKRWLVYQGYHFAAKRSREIWFLNAHDHGYFEAKGWLQHAVARILPGEGVNTKTYTYKPLPTNHKPRILFFGRLLETKGLRIFSEVARQFLTAGHDAEFLVYGFLDNDHPDQVTSEEIQCWTREGIITYKGTSDEPADVYAEVDLVIVPTLFREGLNRVIQEALASGRPVITTSVPGAGELVKHGETGYVVPPGQVAPIVEVLEHHFGLSDAQRSAMGKLGARRVAEKYSVEHVLPHYWDAIARYATVS